LTGPAQQALEAFVEAGTPEELRRTRGHHSTLSRPGFLAVLEQFITAQIPTPMPPALLKALGWPRQIIAERGAR
jgi:hypothetical protein